MLRVRNMVLVLVSASFGESGKPTCFVAKYGAGQKPSHQDSCCHRPWPVLGVQVASKHRGVRIHGFSMNFSPNGDGQPLQDNLRPSGKRFVSRELTEALLDKRAQTTQPPEKVQGGMARPSKRAMLRKAASRVVDAIFSGPLSLTERLFASRQPPPRMPQDVKTTYGLAQVQPLQQSTSYMSTSNTQKLAGAENAESVRVFDLLNKYSQRHSNGSRTLSDSSERRPIQKSKYANLYHPDAGENGVMKSKTGKVLQKSRYADVWSAQDEIKGVRRPQTSTQFRSQDSINEQAAEQPSSRLEQLMSSYSDRYPTDAKYFPKDGSQLLRRGPSDPEFLTMKSMDVDMNALEASPEGGMLSRNDADDSNYGAMGGGGGKTSLSASAGTRFPSGRLADSTTSRLSRMQLLMPIRGTPPVTRIFSIMLTWLFMSLFTVLDSFAERNVDP